MGRVEIDNWSDKIEDVLFRCERQPVEISELLREMHFLLGTGPADICGGIRPQISQSSLQILLEAGAFESAALRLVSKCGYMLSGGGEGHFIATVVVPAAGRDYSYNATTEAVAVCGALATALQESLSPE